MKKRKSVRQKKNPQITQIIADLRKRFFSREVLIVSGLLLLAFILRLVYLSHLKVNDPNFYQPAPGTDMLTYHNFAQQVVNGTYGKEPYYYGPLYYYFLALIYKIFGVDPYVARLSQMILGVLTSLLIYLIARKVFNKPVALISLVISIFYGMFYIHEGVLLIEPLATFLNTLSIFLLLRIEDKPSYKNITLAGIAIGLSALCRANILFFVPFLFIWILIIMKPQMNADERRNQKGLILTAYNLQLKRFAFLCLIIGITISPATIRNYLVSGKFVLISINGPVNLWIGNNPYAEGWFKYPPSEYSDKVSQEVKEKGDVAYIEEVIRFVREYPAQFAKLLFKKLLLFWDSTEIANNINYELYKDLSWILKIVILGFGIITTLAILGILLSLKAWKRNFLLYFFILSFMLATISLFVLARYRIAFVPVLIPFAGFAIWWWYEKIRTKSYQTISLSLIPLIFSFSLAHSRAIEGILASYIYPDGFHIKREDEVVIRDDSGLLHGKEVYPLQFPSDCIKKEIIITEELDRFKEIIIFFSFNYYPFITKNKKEILVFSVNGKKQEFEIKPVQLTSSYSLYFSPNDLNRGKNVVIIKPKTEFRSPFYIKIDTSFSFGRSCFLNKKSEWERLKKGEYILEIVLKTERSVNGFIAQGVYYSKKGMYNEAISEFQQALKKDPASLNIHYNLGVVYEKIKELDKAIEVYKKGIKALIKDKDKNMLLDLHNNLARIYYEKKMIRETIEECKEILILDPKNVQGRNNLIELKKMVDKN